MCYNANIKRAGSAAQSFPASHKGKNEMKIREDIIYTGVNDEKIDLFEAQYPVKHGMSYDSYVILDEKVCVFDTTDRFFVGKWLENIADALGGRAPDYLIVQHMEPDHSSGIAAFAAKYPGAEIVASAAAFTMMGQFFGESFSDRRVVVSDGSGLSLGKHELTFFTAPMVHWPEVIVTYDSYSKILFSADAFGTFGMPGADFDRRSESRRYYFGIVGKYGMQVASLLKKLSGAETETICPLHGGPIGKELPEYLALYDKWSRYEPEDEDGVTVAYTSVYGHTASAAERLCDMLAERGKKAYPFDLTRCDMSEAVSSAFGRKKLVLATTTYNMDIFPPMREFIAHLTERGYKNRRIALIENGSWAPAAAKKMRALLEGSAGIEFVEPVITIKSSLTESNLVMLERLADEI